ncbi:MAG: hypothetical protein AAFV07_11540 [Bacteroidota bacterium]
MSKSVHAIYVWSMVAVTLLVTGYLSYVGYTYYGTPLEERFYHTQHDWFKPSGIFGQGLGIIGTLLITIGVTLYIARKRYNFLARFIRLKYLLEFHIFLCTVGPIMVLFHTAFKFGGIVSVAFWSMVAVVASGVIGRFIYIQIPRTIEGRALSLQEVKELKSDLAHALKERFRGNDSLMALSARISNETDQATSRQDARELRKVLKNQGLPRTEQQQIMGMVKEEISLTGKIGRLQTMQRLFKYWHVAHLPFAIVMLIIVIVHITVALTFGYTWIF